MYLPCMYVIRRVSHFYSLDKCVRIHLYSPIVPTHIRKSDITDHWVPATCEPIPRPRSRSSVFQRVLFAFLCLLYKSSWVFFHHFAQFLVVYFVLLERYRLSVSLTMSGNLCISIVEAGIELTRRYCHSW